MENFMEKESNYLSINRIMLEITIEEEDMAREHMFRMMEPSTKANGIMVRDMALGYFNTQMVIFMKASGQMEKRKVKDISINKIDRMEIIIEENAWIAKRMGMV